MWTAGVILFVLFLNRFISRYLARLVFKIFPKRLQVYDPKQFTDLVVHPLGIFLVISVCIVAFYKLHYPPPLQVKICT